MQTNGIVRHVEQRKPEIRSAKVLRHARQRAADVAHELSRRGAAQAQAELCNEAVSKLIHLCYEPDTDGQPANVDRVTGRILVPKPWGSVGYQRYAMRSTQARVLRRYVQFLELQRHPTRLFFFEPQDWYLNVWDYPSETAALRYWELVQVDVAVWRRFLAEIQA